ncbi:hypothetical protein D9M70_578550 [compost metagenome]
MIARALPSAARSTGGTLVKSRLAIARSRNEANSPSSVWPLRFTSSQMPRALKAGSSASSLPSWLTSSHCRLLRACAASASLVRISFCPMRPSPFRSIDRMPWLACTQSVCSM